MQAYKNTMLRWFILWQRAVCH